MHHIVHLVAAVFHHTGDNFGLTAGAVGVDHGRQISSQDGDGVGDGSAGGNGQPMAETVAVMNFIWVASSQFLQQPRHPSLNDTLAGNRFYFGW